MYDSLIVPYDLSIQLGIVRIMCHGKEKAQIGKMTTEEDDIEDEDDKTTEDSNNKKQKKAQWEKAKRLENSHNRDKVVTKVNN